MSADVKLALAIIIIIIKLKNNLNKITRYLNDRYIFLNQITWNLFEFRNYNENSFIMRLIMHLSD